MKSTGIVRKVDSLGRIVIPKELCNVLGIEPKGALEIFVEGNYVILQKHKGTSARGQKGNIGIVRNADSVGRVVIPKEICKKLVIEQGDSLEIFVEDTKIILSKYQPGCKFCGEMDNLVAFRNEHVCKNCIEELNNLLK